MEIGMIIGCTVEFMTGLACVVLGVLIWKKQKVSLIHDYHYRNVKKADIPAYTRSIGMGLILIGTGILITGIFDLMGSPLWWIPMLAGFVIGTAVIIIGQKKYNGSIFS